MFMQSFDFVASAFAFLGSRDDRGGALLHYTLAHLVLRTLFGLRRILESKHRRPALVRTSHLASCYLTWRRPLTSRAMCVQVRHGVVHFFGARNERPCGIHYTHVELGRALVLVGISGVLHPVLDRAVHRIQLLGRVLFRCDPMLCIPTLLGGVLELHADRVAGGHHCRERPPAIAAWPHRHWSRN